VDNRELIALVTGGASGIGLACAAALLRDGARVVINDLHAERLNDAQQKLLKDGAHQPSQIMTACADVTDSAAVTDMFSEIARNWGPVTALVNNAAISGGRKMLNEIPEEDWDRTVMANLRGMYLCTRAALPAMYERRWDRVVNIASIAGVTGNFPSSPHYAATKGAIVAFTRKVAVEAAAQNVAVNCVAPGLIAETGFTHGIKGKLLADYLQLIPASRAGRAEEVADLVAFLRSPRAGYIQAQTICIDGGASA